jgi:hypothetical protein
MAHYFLQAPADLTVEAGLRWGQIHALGGSERLVRAVIGTRPGTDFQNEEFWVTVLQFFIANPMLDSAHVGPIIDYIHQQRFVAQDVFVAPGVVERRGPAQPNFTMRGRTPASLLRQVEAWHRTLAKREQPKAEWPRSRIDAFEFVEGAERGGRHSEDLDAHRAAQHQSARRRGEEDEALRRDLRPLLRERSVLDLDPRSRDVRGTREGFDRRSPKPSAADLSGPRQVQHAARRGAPWHPAPLGRERGIALGELRVIGDDARFTPMAAKLPTAQWHAIRW